MTNGKQMGNVLIRYLPAFDAYLYDGEVYKGVEVQASATYQDYKKDGSIKIAQVIERIRLARERRIYDR